MNRILGKPPEYQCVGRFPTPKLRDKEELVLIVEPTGGYEQMLARFAISNGRSAVLVRPCRTNGRSAVLVRPCRTNGRSAANEWQVALVNPGQVRQWIKAIGTRGKTDRLDSQLLARYGAEVHPPLWTPPPEEVEPLSHLLSRLDDLKKMLRAEKNRQHTSNTQPVCSKTARESIDKSIAFIEPQIEIVSKAILEHFQNHPLLAHKAEPLKSIPGIGEKKVIPLRVLLEQFSTLTHGSANAKQLTAYVGLDPVDHQSGSRVFRRSTISKRGNKRLRSQLYVGALGGIRGNNRLRHFYHRLVEKGKSKKLALCACARKMLVWSWAVFNTDPSFDAAVGNPALGADETAR